MSQLVDVGVRNVKVYLKSYFGKYVYRRLHFLCINLKVLNFRSSFRTLWRIAGSMFYWIEQNVINNSCPWRSQKRVYVLIVLNTFIKYSLTRCAEKNVPQMLPIFNENDNAQMLPIFYENDMSSFPLSLMFI
jgi:hypothetical protein